MDNQTFQDNYDHLSDDIEYILENVLQDDDRSGEFKELEELFHSSIMNGCECEDCGEKCSHGGNYVNSGGDVVLREDRPCKDLIYECSDNCRCKFCPNKLVQFGPRDGLKIQIFDAKGAGLVSSNFIRKGSFICEYAGEILTKSEAHRRDHQNHQENKMNYIFCLNEINSSDHSVIQTFIDPSRKGNIGRNINHSCDANCDIISTRVDSIIPKIAIFANRDIPPMTEITFNYGSTNQELTVNANRKKCFCNSQNCKLFLPNFSF